MRAILGIDAAWTEREPSGVALIEGDFETWSVVCVAPSYDAFIACGQGSSVDWQAPRFSGSWPNMSLLIKAAREMTSAELSVVPIDIPVATVPFDSRRAADTAISKKYGGRGCAAHSPSADRPGRIGQSLMAQLETAGLPLATTAHKDADSPCTIEVYPHPALLALLGRNYRVPYKVSRSGRYWPGASVPERTRNILDEFENINRALGAIFGGVPMPLPSARDAPTLSRLKRYEDGLDALVCAWVGLEFVRADAIPYGDESAAIWVPEVRAIDADTTRTSNIVGRLSERLGFHNVDWSAIPSEPGVYVIYDLDEVVYVGMAGRNGRGSLRNRLRDHFTGQIVNMFAQYLFLARIQFIPKEPITHPRDAKSACQKYIGERCSFRYLATADAAEARDLENRLKVELRPTLNP